MERHSPIGDPAPAMQAGVLAWRLRCHEENRHSLWGWLHASRRTAAVSLLAAARSPWARQRNAHLWLQNQGYPFPPLAAFMDAGQAFYQLPVRDLLLAARLRALYARRGQLRHWVGPDHRRQLAQWLGPRAMEWLRAILAAACGSDQAGGAQDRLLMTLSGDELAWEGYRLLLGDGVLAPDGPASLLPLALDREVAANEPAPAPANREAAALVAALAAPGPGGVDRTP